ncbi:MAG: hypothetical protein ACUVWX_10570 [Kiritimatiellia bacterium]
MTEETVLAHVCWQGLEIELPPDWELVRATPPSDPPACTFADRRYERLRLRWQQQPPPGDMRKLFEEDPDGGTGPSRSVLTAAPAGWHGLVTELGRACVVHAGRFFPSDDLLVEAIIIWPEGRPAALENRLLASIRPSRPVEGVRLWEAMGLRMWIGGEFDLISFRADAGLTEWRFELRQGQSQLRKESAERRGSVSALLVRRIALPRYWLTVPLDQWIESHLPAGTRVKARRRDTFRGHETFILESCEATGLVDRLRGKCRLRLDLAWECAVEARVYYVTWMETKRGEGIVLPEHVRIECCRPHLPVARERRRKTESG